MSSAQSSSVDDVLDLPVAGVQVEERRVAEINGETREIPRWYLGKWPRGRRQIRRIITTEWSDDDDANH